MSAPAREASALVLAGGSSRRMGRDKAFLEVDGREVLARILDVALIEVSDIVIVANDQTAYAAALERYGWAAAGRRRAPHFEREERRVRLLPDRRPGFGPLAGLEVGLAATEHPEVWVLACDLPFVTPSVGHRLLEALREVEPVRDAAVDEREPRRRMSRAARARGEEDAPEPPAVVPELGEASPPLCLACAADAAEVAGDCLDEGKHRLLDFLAELRVRPLPAAAFADLGDPERLFFNLNRPEDLERATDRRA